MTLNRFHLRSLCYLLFNLIANRFGPPSIFAIFANQSECLLVRTHMASSAQTRSKAARKAAEATLARSLAPEEIYPGDYVTPRHVIAEMPSWFWFCESWNLPVEEPIRVRFMSPDGGVPLHVKSVCLPFVLVKTAAGEQLTVDTRKIRLARLDRHFAKRAWKSYKKRARGNTSVACSS